MVVSCELSRCSSRARAYIKFIYNLLSSSFFEFTDLVAFISLYPFHLLVALFLCLCCENCSINLKGQLFLIASVSLQRDFFCSDGISRLIGCASQIIVFHCDILSIHSVVQYVMLSDYQVKTGFDHCFM